MNLPQYLVTDSVRLVALYSSPLVFRDGADDFHPIETLDFARERECLIESLEKSKREIEITIANATTDNFSDQVTLGCRALHYSGHGHPDCLAFEDGEGVMHPLMAGDLKRLFAAGGTRGVRMAFVSACHSRRAGDAFAAAGVPHVVAINLEEPVFDVAAIAFARAFYLALFLGKTVREAFDRACAVVENSPDLPAHLRMVEAGKFLLLPEYGNHDKAIFEDAPRGDYRDASPPRCRTNLPAAPETFIGRNIDWQQVISLVLRNRLVTLRGAPGIGKTSLATAVGGYLAERRAFRDGVFFIALRSAETSDTARDRMATAAGIEARNEEELFSALRDRRCLFVLDNCEDLLRKPGSGFRKFVEGALAQAPRVRLLLTSREQVGALPGVAEKIYQLRRLPPRAAARLFVESSPRRLTRDEIASADFAGLIEFLSGHPHATRLAAALLADKSLARVSEQLRAEKVDALRLADIPEDERDAANTFAVSLGVSARHVREQNPEAARLFAMMGLLPGGALSRDLDVVWGHGWRLFMDLLVRVSLIERDVYHTNEGEAEHFSTFPFITDYARRTLTAGDLQLFSSRAEDHFADVSRALYQNSVSVNAAAARWLLEIEEANLIACLETDRPSRLGENARTPSPVGMIASNLPGTLLLLDRVGDGLKAATLGLDACRRLGDAPGEANVLQAMGDLQMRVADLAGARASYEQASPIYREIEARRGEANVLAGIGRLALAEGNQAEADRLLEQAIAIYQTFEDRYSIAAQTGNYGFTLLQLGHREQARPYLLRAADRFEEIGGFDVFVAQCRATAENDKED